jgi:hypothetical protein
MDRAGSAIACVATTHFAVLLLSLLEGREYVRQAHNRLVGGVESSRPHHFKNLSLILFWFSPWRPSG